MPNVRVCVLRCKEPEALHNFPNRETDRERREKWLRLLGMDMADTTKHIFACSRHFSLRQRAAIKLRQDALPDMNLPEHSSDKDHNYSLSQNSNAYSNLDVDDAAKQLFIRNPASQYIKLTGAPVLDSKCDAGSPLAENPKPEVRKLYIKLKDPDAQQPVVKPIKIIPLNRRGIAVSATATVLKPATVPEVIPFRSTRQIMRLIEPTPGTFVKVLEQIYEPGFQPIAPAALNPQVVLSPSPAPVEQSPPASFIFEDDEPVVRVSFKPTRPHKRIFADPLEMDAFTSREALAQNCQEEGFITLVNRGTQTELGHMHNFMPEMRTLPLEHQALVQKLEDKEKEIRGLKTLLSLSQSRNIRLSYVHVKNT